MKRFILATAITVFILAAAITAFLLVLSWGQAAGPKTTDDSVEAIPVILKPYGYFIGDVISFSYVFKVKNSDIELNFSRLPEPGQRYGEFVIRSLESKYSRWMNGSYEVRLDFTVQTFAVRDAQQYIDFPIEVFASKIPDGEVKMLDIAPIRILISPISLPTEKVPDNPYGLEAFAENRWHIIGISGLAGATLFLWGIVGLRRVIMEERRRQKVSPLAMAYCLLRKNLEENRDKKEAIRIFRRAVWEKFKISPTSTSAILIQAVSSHLYWQSFAQKLGELWARGDQVLFAETECSKRYLEELLNVLGQLDRREKDEI